MCVFRAHWSIHGIKERVTVIGRLQKFIASALSFTACVSKIDCTCLWGRNTAEDRCEENYLMSWWQLVLFKSSKSIRIKAVGEIMHPVKETPWYDIIIILNSGYNMIVILIILQAAEFWNTHIELYLLPPLPPTTNDICKGKLCQYLFYLIWCSSQSLPLTLVIFIAGKLLLDYWIVKQTDQHCH